MFPCTQITQEMLREQLNTSENPVFAELQLSNFSTCRSDAEVGVSVHCDITVKGGQDASEQMSDHTTMKKILKTQPECNKTQLFILVLSFLFICTHLLIDRLKRSLKAPCVVFEHQ